MRITKNGIVRVKIWTRQTLSDAWEPTKWEGLCDTPWHIVAPEFKLTKKVTVDSERMGRPLPRIVAERAPECLLTLKIEVQGHTGGCPGCAAHALHGKATKPHNDECRQRIRTIVGRTLMEEARIECVQRGNRRDRVRQREEQRSTRARCRRCAHGTWEQT